jgi:hypothetical protein
MSSRNGDVVRVSLVPAKGAVCCTLTLFDGHRERRDRLAGLGDMEPELVYRVLAALCQTMS